jgi:hypothetical protein
VSDNTPNTVVRRSRRRLAVWLAFAALGVSMGAVWATGYANITGNAGSDSGSPIVATTGPTQPTSNLNTTASANGAGWTVAWNGLQGSTTKQWFFKVDLTGHPTGTYNVAALLSNGAAVSASNWSTLQLQMENFDSGTDNTFDCSTATFDGTQSPKTVTFDTQDAGAYWNGLAGGHVYCIGIAASAGMDTTGTFLRRADTSTIPVNPSFVATVNRAS